MVNRHMSAIWSMYMLRILLDISCPATWAPLTLMRLRFLRLFHFIYLSLSWVTWTDPYSIFTDGCRISNTWYTTWVTLLSANALNFHFAWRKARTINILTFLFWRFILIMRRAITIRMWVAWLLFEIWVHQYLILSTVRFITANKAHSLRYFMMFLSYTRWCYVSAIFYFDFLCSTTWHGWTYFWRTYLYMRCLA